MDSDEGEQREYVDLDERVDDPPKTRPVPEAETIEELGRQFAGTALACARWELDDALAPLEDAMETGVRPTSEEIRAARSALDRQRDLVERLAGVAVGGVEPWDEGPGRDVPRGVLREELEAAGYDVEYRGRRGGHDAR